MAKSKDSVMEEDKGKVRFAFYTDEPTMELVNQHYKATSRCSIFVMQ